MARDARVVRVGQVHHQFCSLLHPRIFQDSIAFFLSQSSATSTPKRSRQPRSLAGLDCLVPQGIQLASSESSARDKLVKDCGCIAVIFNVDSVTRRFR